MSFDQQTTQRESFTLRTLEEIEGIMSGVARSIEALDTGTYGLCEHCATPIAKQTLVDNPLATRCDAHIVQDRPVLFTDGETTWPSTQTPHPPGPDRQEFVGFD